MARAKRVAIYALLGLASIGCDRGRAPGDAAEGSPDNAAAGEAKPAAGSKAAADKPVEPVKDSPVPPGLAPTMAGHFDQVARLEQAVIDGDLEAAAEPARWLAEELPRHSLAAAWRPCIDDLQQAAGRAAGADDFPTVAAATGELLAACGACHAALGTGPRLEAPAPVPEGETTEARMARHQWALARMREAMITASDERWRLGSEAVSVAPPEPCPIPSAHVLPQEVLALRERIYDIGAEALEQRSRAERAASYGALLSTCVGCHVGGC